MITVLIMAGVGLIVNLIGKWLVIQEDQALSKSARWAVMLIPGAELIYILLRWERAKAGSVVCALSLGLALPIVGQASLLARTAGNAGERSWLKDEWSRIVGGDSGERQQAQVRADRERLIAVKREKLAELETYLKQWYELLEARKQQLSDEQTEEMRTFNRDAAAYHGLLAASKVELLELRKLTESKAN